jgi:hypothetical protein
VKLGLATRDRGPIRTGSGAPSFGGASCGIAASFPSRNRCRPSPCAGLSPARSTTAAPPRPGPISGRRAHPTNHIGYVAAGRTRTVPVFTVIRSTKEEPDSVPAASPRLPRSTSPWSPGQPSKTNLGVPHPRGRVRTAPGPYPPDLSQYTLERRKRRFLAYSFPSCSPDPHHLAVLARPGFVRAACHPPQRHPGRAALSSACLLRQDRR